MKTTLKIIALISSAASAHLTQSAAGVSLAQRTDERQANFAQTATESAEFTLTDAADESDCCCWCGGCGCCGCGGAEPDYWWQDTWYSWGMDWYWTDGAYETDGEWYYCASTGQVYVYDPAAWGYVAGWPMVTANALCDPANPGSPLEMLWWMDTWYSWGSTWYETEYAYEADGTWYYCATNDLLYVYDPSVWGYVAGWPMAWAGFCDADAPGVGLLWWQDTWYSWGMDWYLNTEQVLWTEGGELTYCAASGDLYLYDPAAWGYTAGWPMVWVDTCNADDPSDPDAGMQWWQDTWYSWGMDFYDNAYWNEGYLQYCFQGTQYTYDFSFWGYVPGWTMFASGECNGLVPAENSGGCCGCCGCCGCSCGCCWD